MSNCMFESAFEEILAKCGCFPSFHAPYFKSNDFFDVHFKPWFICRPWSFQLHLAQEDAVHQAKYLPIQAVYGKQSSVLVSDSEKNFWLSIRTLLNHILQNTRFFYSRFLIPFSFNIEDAWKHATIRFIRFKLRPQIFLLNQFLTNCQTIAC